MSDAITLDQLRMFIAVVDEGSFSAAGRKLKRVQSAVSHAMANLEAQVGIALWDRSTKVPTLTPRGKVLLGSARRICSEVAELKRVAEGLSGGLEAELSLAIDALMPISAVVDLGREFAAQFPSVELRLYTETLSAVSALVLAGTCQIGVIGPAASAPGLAREHLVTVRMLPVVAPSHPLAASARTRIATRTLAEHIHIVLSERGEQRTPDQAVLSPRTWRVADLGTKKALLMAGLGWGNLPEHMIDRELAKQTLVRIRPAAWSDDEWNLPLSIVHAADLAPGPAARWLLARLPALCSRAPGVSAPRRSRKQR
ncbi:MAG: LysR family transcriptional regulator [Polyangiales bacterium]